LRNAQPADIVLLLSDEGEARTHPYLARAWAKRVAAPCLTAPGEEGSHNGHTQPDQRKLIVTTSRTKPSPDFMAHLQALDRLYGPRPGMLFKPTVIVLDNGPIHVS
jgi:hypothetical protein